jgi:hypothetical protein
MVDEAWINRTINPALMGAVFSWWEFSVWAHLRCGWQVVITV